MKKMVLIMLLSFISLVNAQNKDPIFITSEDKNEENLKLSALRLESAYYHSFVQRAEYCSSIGQPINKYVEVYQGDNQKIHQIVISILRKNWNPKQGEFSENAFLQTLSFSMPIMEKQMKDLAYKSNISEKDVCKWFDNTTDETVKKRNLAIISPEASQAVLASMYNK
jgi:hypothetical protein